MKKFISVLVTGAMLIGAVLMPVGVSAEGAQTLFINEVMAANTTTLRDGDVDDTKYGALGGAYSDWIEVYNAGSQPVDLKGYTISDDGATWTLPQGIIPANGYLLIWASDKNKVAKDGQLHANFKLTSSGETVTLKKPDGTTVDAVKFPVLADDQSYGRILDGGAEFTVSLKATPGSKNIAVLPTTNGYTISGYVKPGFSSTNAALNVGFKVEVVENGKNAITDSRGYFEIKDVPGNQTGYTVKISKNNYLTREIGNLAVTDNVFLGTESLPVDIWPGDIAINGVSDNAINMSDIMQIANFFNTVTGDGRYNESVDMNLDGAVNMEDIMIAASNFNKTSANYPAFVTNPPTANPATPINTATPTPTPTVNPEDAWKTNVGTINLGSTITHTGTGISVNGSVVNITAGGDHTVTGTLTNGMIYINTTEKVKLRLSGASITNSNGPAIYVQSADKAYITLVENTINTLVDGRTYSDANAKAALFSNDDLEIKGDGTLNITGNYKHAICSDDDININNGIINVKSAVKDGINANGSIDITGGTINITATSDAIQNGSEEGITIDDGTLTLSAGDQGIRSKTGVKVAGGITINGGTINVTKSREGLSAELITINGGTISIISSDDCTNATMGNRTETNDGSQVVINGGSIYASSQSGDSLDANGSITIKGGTVVVVGPQGMPNVPLDCNGPLTVTGGTVLATGPSMMMAQYPNGASAQYSMAVGLGTSQAANSAVCVKDSTGKVLIITKPARNYVNIVFSSPELKNGSTYTVCYGGTVSGGTTVNGVITGGTYSGGTSTNVIINKSPTTTVNWSSGWGR